MYARRRPPSASNEPDVDVDSSTPSSSLRVLLRTVIERVKWMPSDWAYSPSSESHPASKPLRRCQIHCEYVTVRLRASAGGFGVTGAHR